jgi:hypothetical protein
MRRFPALTAIAVAIAGIWVVSSTSEGQTTTEVDPMTTASIEAAGDVFRMRSSELDLSCRIAKGKKVAGGLSTVTLERGCDAILPGLSRVRFWREKLDGSVELTGEGGDTLAAFSVADGVDYESFRPRSPLITLSSGG